MDAGHTSTDAKNPPACPGCVRRDRRIAELEQRIVKLEEHVATLSRAAKRQAAPFSKGPPKANPKRPGRKAGEDYGIKAFRAVPPTIDKVYEAPLPEHCPHCDGVVLLEKVEHQYQTEIPRKPIHRPFNVHVGHCTRCHRRVQGRHPLQTSDALGCCASQLGPDAQPSVVHLNKDAGLSHGMISTFFSTLFGIGLTRGGACLSMPRTAGKCLPHYHAIARSVTPTPWVAPYETGWRVGGRPTRPHTFVNEYVVAHLVARERGFPASRRIVPEDYAVTMIHDGCTPYRTFLSATHQTCNGHPPQRCHEMLDVAVGGAVIFPRKVKAILQEGLAVRDRRDAWEIVLRTAARKTDELEARMVKLTEPVKTNPANERFAAHLFRQQHHLFTYLRIEGIDANNYRAEQAMKMPIVNRKVWGGNRTETGAAAQSILASVPQTAINRGEQVIDWLSGLLRSPASAEPLVPAASG